MRRLMFALAFVAAACGTTTEPAANDVSANTAAPSTTTTRGLEDATTTTAEVADQPISMATATNTFFEPGVTYRAEFLPASIQIEFVEAGWRTSRIVESASLIIFAHEAGTVATGIAFRSTDVDETVARIADHENVTEITEAGSVIVGGVAGVSFDVLVPPLDRTGQLYPCIGLVFDDSPLASDQAIRGLIGCAWNRVWVFQAGSGSVILFGATDMRDPFATATLDGLGPLLDDFINAITFCTEATPCDG